MVAAVTGGAEPAARGERYPACRRAERSGDVDS